MLTWIFLHLEVIEFKTLLYHNFSSNSTLLASTFSESCFLVLTRETAESCWESNRYLLCVGSAAVFDKHLLHLLHDLEERYQQYFLCGTWTLKPEVLRKQKMSEPRFQYQFFEYLKSSLSIHNSFAT